MLHVTFLNTKGEILVESDSIGVFELHRKAVAEAFWTAEVRYASLKLMLQFGTPFQNAFAA